MRNYNQNTNTLIDTERDDTNRSDMNMQYALETDHNRTTSFSRRKINHHIEKLV